LTEQAQQVLEHENDPATALLLALEALPDPASDDENVRTRPYWAPAEFGLEAARRLLREMGMLIGHTEFYLQCRGESGRIAHCYWLRR